MEDAAGAFNAAAEMVPVNYAAGIEQELEKVAQFCVQAGGGLGDELRQEAAGVQNQAQQLTSLLADLKTKLGNAADQVLRGGG